MWLKILAVPVLFVLPGYVLLSRLNRPRSAVSLLLAIPFSLPFTSLTAFVLASFHHFSLPALLSANIAVALMVMAIPRPSPSAEELFSTRSCLICFSIALIFFLYYQPPFEYYFGGRDPGVYVINGIRLARTGTFVGGDPLPAKISEKYLPLFFDTHNPVRYMGFEVGDFVTGKIIPNFFYLYPAWLGIFYLLFGVHGMLMATPFFASCTLWIVGLFAMRMVSEREWIPVVLVLGGNGIFLWFARYPNSELTATYLVFTALLGFQIYETRGNSAWGFLAAGCLAMAFWGRVDAGLMAACVFLFLLMRYANGNLRKQDVWIVALYVALLSFSLVPSSGRYILAVFRNLRFKPYKVLAALASFAALSAGAAFLLRRWRLLQNPRTGTVLAALLAPLLLYAYFIRPYYPPQNIGSPNEGAFLALGWYFTHPVVVLSLLGFLLYLRRFPAVNTFLLFGTLFYASLYFYRIRAHAEHFWMLRRYLMMICPAIALFSVYAARWLLLQVPRLKMQPAILLLLSLGLSGFYVYDNRDIHSHREFQGSFAFLESIAGRLQPQDLLILGPKEANDLHMIGPFLSYYLDRNVLVLRNSSPDLALLREFLQQWQGNVFFAGVANANLASSQFSLKPVEEIHFETPVFDEVYHQRPRAVLTKLFQIGWYRMLFAPPEHPDFVDVGRYDDGVITDFYLKENYAGITYRWTNGHGHVFFPEGPAPKRIVLVLNPGPWVPGMDRVHVRILLNEQPLGDVTLLSNYNTYTVAVPDAQQRETSGKPIDIQIESKSWVPQRVLGLPDVRRVGVIVDWVKIERGDEAQTYRQRAK